MPFVAARLLEMALRPSMALLLLALAGLLLRQPTLSATGVGGLLAVVLLPLGQWLARPLEDFHARADLPSRVDGIVVLGGAVEQDIFADRGVPALNAAAERMTELVALSRRYPQARLVFTGGSGRLIWPGATEADEARSLFEALGVPPDRMRYEATSRTTWQNATRARAVAEPRAGQVWLLVTSAMHMPRALGAFRAAGWVIEPRPVAYKTLRHGLRWFGSPGERVGLLDAAAHEWAGWLVYRLRGHWRAPREER